MIDYESKISDQVGMVPRSGIRDFFELVIGRDDVISLGVGEPDFPTPWNIRAAGDRVFGERADELHFQFGAA